MMWGPMVNREPDPPSDHLYLDTPYVRILWETGGPWMAIEWKAWANSTEYRAAHELLLGAIRERHTPRLLIDASNARVVSLEDQQWLTATWIPRVVAAGRRWTAVVMPTSALVKTIVENIDKRPSTNSMVEVKYFDRIADAKTWLSTVGH
jgi:hypothetical protein